MSVVACLIPGACLSVRVYLPTPRCVLACLCVLSFPGPSVSVVAYPSPVSVTLVYLRPRSVLACLCVLSSAAVIWFSFACLPLPGFDLYPLDV